MGKIAYRRHLQWLEDVLFAEGVFSFCRDIEADISHYDYQGNPENLIGEPAIAAVVTSWEDGWVLQRILRTMHHEVISTFGEDVSISNQTWHYFLAYVAMGKISSELPNRFFLSTEIKNSKGQGRRVEHPFPHLEFDIRITTIKHTASLAELKEIRSQIAQVLREVNGRSRYLQIKCAETAYTQSKFGFQGDPELHYEPLEF